jgi:hypothetical protein
MTTATDTTPAPAPRFLDVLPKRHGKRIALEWVPHVEDFAHGEGFAILTGDRDRTAYSVCQYPGESALLGFVFTKVGGDKGTDAARESYLLTCCLSGSDAACECKGFVKHRHCKHADSLETLFLNKWL